MFATLKEILNGSHGIFSGREMMIPLKFLEYKYRDTVPLKSGCHAGVQDAGALSRPILEKDSKHNDLLTVSLFQVKA